MIPKHKIPLDQAKRAAETLIELLRPTCTRIEVVGSVRRDKPVVGDIELLCVPKPPRPAFGEPVGLAKMDQLERLTSDLLSQGVLDVRLNAKGRRTWGPKNKLALYRFEGRGLAVDLFSVFPKEGEQWGAAQLIRTGPKQFNIALITQRERGGKVLPTGWKLSVERWAFLDENGEVVPTPEERDVFKALGLPYIPPHERSREELMRESARLRPAV